MTITATDRVTRSAAGDPCQEPATAALGNAVTRWAVRSVLAVFVAVILASYAVPLWFQVNGDLLLVVTSGSMAPQIQPGDAVVIRRVTDASQLRIGQIITFYPTRSDKLVTHRISALTTVLLRDDQDNPVLDRDGKPIAVPYVKTKGDANKVDDPNLTPATQVRGIVHEVYPRWGFALGAAHSPVGRLLLFGPPLLLLLGSEVLSRLPGRPGARTALLSPLALTRRRTPVESGLVEECDDEPALV